MVVADLLCVSLYLISYIFVWVSESTVLGWYCTLDIYDVEDNTASNNKTVSNNNYNDTNNQ